MQMKQSFLLGKKQKDILTIIVYLAFIYFMIGFIIKETQLTVKITYVCILIFFSFIAFYYEYLKKLYEKATLALIEECNPQKGINIIDKLKSKDIFRSFKQSIIIFKLLAYRDLNDYDKMYSILQSLKKKEYSSSYDMLLIYHYSYLLIYNHNKDIENMESTYNKVMELQYKRKGFKKVSPLISWEEATARYYFTKGLYKESKKHMDSVSIDNMNKREKAHYYFLTGKIALAGKRIKQAKQAFSKVIELAPLMDASNESQEYITQFGAKKRTNGGY